MKLEIKNLNYNFGNKTIFNDANLDLEFDNLQILGANGAGKTTFLELINKKKINIATGKIQYIKQNILLFDQMTIREHIAIFNISKQIFTDIKKISSELNIDQKIKNLSGGQKQLVHILLGLNKKADLYLLDEPLNNLDKKVKEKLIQHIIDLKINCIFISHEDLKFPNLKYIKIENGALNVV